MTDTLGFSVAEGIAEIMLNRPEKLNAVTPEMAAAIERHCAEVDRDDAVRVLLLRGAGERAFSAGSDLNSLAEYSSAWKFRNRSEYAAPRLNYHRDPTKRDLLKKDVRRPDPQTLTG